MPAYPKTTAKMTVKGNGTQPVWRCREHWTVEPEVSPISGRIMNTPFPEIERG